MTDKAISLPHFTPTLAGFRADEFLQLTETLLAIPLEQDQAWLNTAPFRLEAPEPLPETPLPLLPPRWYPRPAAEVMEAARASLTPPPRPPIHEGRTQSLERVLRPLLAGHPMIVQGEAGIGKSTLLAVVASHERTRQRFRRIWWLDRPVRFEQTLALALNLPHLLVETDPAVRRAILAKYLDEHTLIVVDNLQADDPLRAWLPALTPHVLLAVEIAPQIPDPDEPFPDDPDGVVTLRPLDDTPAIDVLAHNAGIEDTRRIRGDLQRIARVLDHLPYALMLAGQIIRRDRLALADVEALLAAAPDSADQAGTTNTTPAGDAEGLDPVVQHRARITRPLDLTVAALPGDYRALFEAFGAFPADGAPFDGVRAAAGIENPLLCRRGLVMLEQYGLVRQDHRDPDHYVMPPLAYARAAALNPHGAKQPTGKRMRAWAGHYAKTHAGNPLALYRAESALLHAYQHGHDRALAPALAAYLREHAPEWLDGVDEQPTISGPRAEGAELTRRGIELTDRRELAEAEAVLKQALDIRQAHDSAHAVAETLVALGRLHDLAGRPHQAAEVLIQAAELIYQLNAESSLSVVRRGLSRVYRHLGRLNEALDVLDDAPESHLERALALRAQGNYAAAVSEINQAPEATPYARAELLLLAGRYDEALAAIAAQEDPSSAHLRAQVYHLQGAIAQAIEGYRAALDCCSPTDPTRAKTLRGLGAALAISGDIEGACEAFQAALDMQRRDPDPLLTGRTLRLLAAVYAAAGQDELAIQTAQEAIAALEKGSAPSDTADAYRTLGRALWRRGDYEGALKAFTGEVEYAQSMGERDEARIGIALHHFADAYRATGQLDRAVANYRRALTHKNPIHDPTGTLITQLALHRALMELGRYPAALDVAQEIVDLLLRQPRPDLQQIGYAQAVRARTQQAMQRPIRAGQSLQEWAHLLAARADEAANDPRPALRVLVLGLAARSLLAENRPILALEVAGKSLEQAEAHFPGTAAAWAARRDLGEAYAQMEDWEAVVLALEPLLAPDVAVDPATRALAFELSGLAYRRLGDRDAALRHLRQALDHEPEPLRQGLMQATMGDILLEIGQPAEAIDTYRGALERLPRKDHPAEVARILTTMAHTLGGLNRYAEAIGVYEEALIVLRDVPDVSPVHTAEVLRSLGQTHEAQGQLPDAARAYRRALNVLERSDTPRQTRDLLHLLARVTAAQGDQSAVQLYEQTRDLTREWGDDRELGEVLGELADVHRDAGRLPLAIQNYHAALDCLTVPLFARDRARILRSLGRAYAQMERYDEARAAWTEALELSADLPDRSPLEVALTHHAIGEAYRHQKHYADAERSYREALRFHTPGTVAAAATWRALGQALHDAGRYDDALEPLQHALDAEKNQPQQANARIVQTLQLLAETQKARGDPQAAIARHHEALVYMDRRLQPVAYADTLRTLGALYGDLDHYEEAHKAYNEALEIEGDHVPRSDDRISATLQAIADLYRAQGDLEKAAEYYQKVTVYANMARRASDDLKQTLDELDRRRETLQAAQQSLALLGRTEDASLKDLAFIYALIAKAHASLNQPQESADTINTLLDVLDQRRDELDHGDEQPDVQALAWLAQLRQAQASDQTEAAIRACESALQRVRNANLRWVIEQVIRSLE